jgi:cytochrome c peroxidase
MMALAVAASFALAERGRAASAETPELREQARKLIGALPDRMPGAEKDTPAQVALGRKLFFDPLLSANRSQSCNSCHRVDEGRGGVDNEVTSVGAFGKRGGRNSPTVLNAGFHLAQFWDGRAATLEDQAKGPVLNPIEMAMPKEEEVVRRLSADKSYPGLFAKAFPGAQPAVSYDHMARAIAAFERTLRTQDRFDDFLKGDDRALTEVEQRGLKTFLTVGCTTCHNGPLLGGNGYHKVGLVHPYPTGDVGRFEVTKDEDDKLKFKVPTLRNIALTAPYFHDGKQSTLDQTVKTMAHLQLDKTLTEGETQDLVAFLKALTDKERGNAKKTRL